VRGTNANRSFYQVFVEQKAAAPAPAPGSAGGGANSGGCGCAVEGNLTSGSVLLALMTWIGVLAIWRRRRAYPSPRKAGGG
jgi:MYXO-CTERM domain-containing protein